MSRAAYDLRNKEINDRIFKSKSSTYPTIPIKDERIQGYVRTAPVRMVMTNQEPKRVAPAKTEMQKSRNPLPSFQEFVQRISQYNGKSYQVNFKDPVMKELYKRGVNWNDQRELISTFPMRITNYNPITNATYPENVRYIDERFNTHSQLPVINFSKENEDFASMQKQMLSRTLYDKLKQVFTRSYPTDVDISAIIKASYPQNDYTSLPTQFVKHIADDLILNGNNNILELSPFDELSIYCFTHDVMASKLRNENRNVYVYPFFPEQLEVLQPINPKPFDRDDDTVQYSGYFLNLFNNNNDMFEILEFIWKRIASVPNPKVYFTTQTRLNSMNEFYSKIIRTYVNFAMITGAPDNDATKQLFNELVTDNATNNILVRQSQAQLNDMLTRPAIITPEVIKPRLKIPIVTKSKIIKPKIIKPELEDAEPEDAEPDPPPVIAPFASVKFYVMKTPRASYLTSQNTREGDFIYYHEKKKMVLQFVSISNDKITLLSNGAYRQLSYRNPEEKARFKKIVKPDDPYKSEIAKVVQSDMVRLEPTEKQIFLNTYAAEITPAIIPETGAGLKKKSRSVKGGAVIDDYREFKSKFSPTLSSIGKHKADYLYLLSF